MKLGSHWSLFLVCVAATVSGHAFAASSPCSEKTLKFSADHHPAVPAAGSGVIWGGNATEGHNTLFSGDFLRHARRAKANGLEVFAYLEGPCGNTGDQDDGEIARCAKIHRAFNKKHAPGTKNTPDERWKPFTFQQLKDSGKHGIDFCEVDNLSNNVTIPLLPFLRDVKAFYERGEIHCQLVLKNISLQALASVKREFPSFAQAEFIAPFHIFENETNNPSLHASLTAAMTDLKGPGAVTIISTDTEHYGSKFTNDRILTCPRGGRAGGVKSLEDPGAVR